MTNTIAPATLDDLLSLFAETLSPSEVLSSKAMAEASKSITKERLRLGMNQTEFADYIHVKQSLISRWESGQYNFSIQKLSEIAASLDMDLSVKLRRKPELKYSYNEHYCQSCPITNSYNYVRREQQKKRAVLQEKEQCYNISYKPKNFNELKSNQERKMRYVKLCK